MRIAVIGSGYVGLVSAACFAEIGHEVISVDNDAAKIAALERGETPIHEEYLPELLARHRGGRLKFSTSVAHAVEESDAIFITVGTPQSETGEADLSYVEAVAREIGPAIRGSKVIVEKSTVPVKTAESLRRTLLLSGAEPGTFSVVSNPEFLREGTAVTDFLYPDRIVVGADDEVSAATMSAIYRPLTAGTYYEQEQTVPFSGYCTFEGADHHDRRQELGIDQARFERVSGDEDFVHQCRGEHRRERGSGHRAGLQRDRERFANRSEVPECGNWLRWFVLPQGCAGIPRSRPASELRFRFADGSDANQRGPAAAVHEEGAKRAVDAASASGLACWDWRLRETRTTFGNLRH